MLPLTLFIIGSRSSRGCGTWGCALLVRRPQAAVDRPMPDSTGFHRRIPDSQGIPPSLSARDGKSDGPGRVRGLNRRCPAERPGCPRLALANPAFLPGSLWGRKDRGQPQLPCPSRVRLDRRDGVERGARLPCAIRGHLRAGACLVAGTHQGPDGQGHAGGRARPRPRALHAGRSRAARSGARSLPAPATALRRRARPGDERAGRAFPFQERAVAGPPASARRRLFRPHRRHALHPGARRRTVDARSGGCRRHPGRPVAHLQDADLRLSRQSRRARGQRAAGAAGRSAAGSSRTPSGR